VSRWHKGAGPIAAAVAGVVLFAAVGGFILWTRVAAAQPATAADSGYIDGRVEQPPGRDPRSGVAGSPQPVNGDPILVADARGTIVARTTTVDGSFRVAAPVGRYTVREQIFGISREVDVSKGSVSKVTLTVPAG
jgi:hypothetical protein